LTTWLPKGFFLQAFRRIEPFSLVLWGSVFLLMQFLPGFFGGGKHVVGSDVYGQLVITGLTCFAVGAVLGARVSRHMRCGAQSPIAWDSRVAMAISLVLFFAGFAVKLRHCDVSAVLSLSCLPDELKPWAPNLIHRVSVCVMAIALLAENRTKMHAVSWVVGLFGGYLVWSIGANAGRFEVVAALITFSAVMWFLGGGRARVPLILLAVCAVPIFLAKSWMKYSVNLAPGDLAAFGVASFIYEAIVARISQHEILDAILSHWDQPFIGFSGWTDFFNGLLSQQLIYLNGNDLGKAFGVIHWGDVVTGVGPTFMGDFYLRGGIQAVAAGMALSGLAFSLLTRLVHQQGGSVVILIYAMLLPILVHGLEDWVFLTLARAVQVTLVCLLVAGSIAWASRCVYSAGDRRP
jgi:hypothetical protein